MHSTKNNNLSGKMTVHQKPTGWGVIPAKSGETMLQKVGTAHTKALGWEGILASVGRRKRRPVWLELEHERKVCDEVMEEGKSQIIQWLAGHVRGFVFYSKCSVSHWRAVRKRKEKKQCFRISMKQGLRRQSVWREGSAQNFLESKFELQLT